MNENFTTADTTTTARSELDDVNHPLNQISSKIRDSIFKIHRHFGPGLMENAYEECLYYDLITNHKLKIIRQKTLPIIFENLIIKDAYRIDLLVEDQIIIEVKTVEKLLPVHQAQLMTYMKLSGCKLGYLVNFNEKLVKDGIRRFVL